MTEQQRIVVLCPATGRVSRVATPEEVESYWSQNRPPPWDENRRVGDFVVVNDTGPGLWFGGAGF